MSEIHSSVGASGRSWVAMWSDMLLPPPRARARARAQYAAESPTKPRDSQSPGTHEAHSLLASVKQNTP